MGAEGTLVDLSPRLRVSALCFLAEWVFDAETRRRSDLRRPPDPSLDRRLELGHSRERAAHDQPQRLEDSGARVGDRLDEGLVRAAERREQLRPLDGGRVVPLVELKDGLD